MLSNNLDEAHASELAVIVLLESATKFVVATEDEFPGPQTHP